MVYSWYLSNLKVRRYILAQLFMGFASAPLFFSPLNWSGFFAKYYSIIQCSSFSTNTKILFFRNTFALFIFKETILRFWLEFLNDIA